MGLYLTSQWTGFFGRLKKVQTKDRETEKKLAVETEKKIAILNLSQLSDSSMNDNTVPIGTKPNMKRKKKINRKNYMRRS